MKPYEKFGKFKRSLVPRHSPKSGKVWCSEWHFLLHRVWSYGIKNGNFKSGSQVSDA